MLPKEKRDLIMLAGRYTYYKMKDLGLPLNIQSYKEYLENIEKERRLKKKMGTTRYKKMKDLKMTYEDFIQYEKEQKLKKYETKREKDKIRQKTVRYIERYCNLDMKCQICETKEKIQIHHPNYKDYLKINLLCIKHHNDLHKFELIPPQIIDLEKIAIIKPPMAEKETYINNIMENLKEDVINDSATYRTLAKKYNLAPSTIRNHFLKRNDYQEIRERLKKNYRDKLIKGKNYDISNPLVEFKIKNDLTNSKLSEITKIPIPTLWRIENGKTNLKDKTRRKLQLCGIKINQLEK